MNPLTAATLAAGTSLSANEIFLEAPTYGSGGDGAYSVAVGDVNGDGKPDLLVVNVCASSSSCTNGVVGVLLGNGDGTFQAAVSYDSGGLYAYSVAVGDVNGDGKPDLLVANACNSSSNCTNGTVGVLLGNGDGTFQPAVNYGSGGLNPLSVEVADVNGDGKPDLVVANLYMGNGNYSKSTVGVLLGNGDGTFQTAVSYDSGGLYAYSVAVGDVNGDSKPDLVVATQCVSSTNCVNGEIGVLLGNGNGTFQASVPYGSGGTNATAVALGDVNGDGKPDVVVSNQCGSFNDCQNVSGTVGVLLGNGDGTFQAAVAYNSTGYGSYSVIVDDVNGDGKPDLLVGNQCEGPPDYNSCGNGTITVLLGNGDGSFQAAFTYASGGYAALSLAFSDVNGDGKLDVVAANSCVSINNCVSGGVSVLAGNGDGTFHAAPVHAPGGYIATAAATWDVNGDGKPDVLLANSCLSLSNCAVGGVNVLLGNGDGAFRPAVSYGSGGYHASWVEAADVNGDGRPDLLVANQCASSSNCANGTVGVLLQNADGSFQTAVTYGSGGYYTYSLDVADVNGDGKPDLVVASQCATNVNCTNGIVGVLLGNGDGTFRPAVTYSSGGEFAFWVRIADVNNDGKVDLLIANGYASAANQSTGAMAVLLGNGDGTFQPAVTYLSGGQSFYAAAVADVNGDGRPDLVVANGCAVGNCTTGVLGVLLGNGDGTFQPAVTSFIPQAGGSPQLAITDFDGNGTLDVASGAGNFLLLGNGDGTFQSPLILGAGGEGIAVGDFNRDGKPDLAVGGVTVLLNINPTTPRIPAVTLSATSLSFAGELLDTTSTSKSVTLTNSGTGSLLISSIVASGNFGLSSTCPISPSALAVGANCKIAVTFTPSVPGSISGEITIANNALNSPQLVKLTGTGLAPLSVSPASLSFGTVTVGTTTLAKSVTLSNNSSTALTIAYAGSADYTVVPGGTTPCSASLAAKAKCTLNVTFTPSQNGSINGALTATYNGSFSPQEVALSGSGTGGLTAPLGFSPSSLNFAGQLIATTSSTKTVTVTNKSTSAVTINSNGLSTTGNYSVMGSGIAPCPGATLAASGGKCTFAVSFSPSINGTIKGAVSIADTAGVTPQIYNLSGTGALPLTFSPASLTFGTQVVGITSLPNTVTVTNNLSTAISIAITPSGDFGVSTNVTNGCGSTLNGLAKCNFVVTFTPSNTGTITGVVTVTYTGNNFSPQELKLSGTGQ